MTKLALLSFTFCFIVFGCTLPTVGYFTIQPNIRAYQIETGKSMTIALDPDIADSLVIKSAGLKDMTVVKFRQTLEDALKNTFKSSYTEVDILSNYVHRGTSLVFVKVAPDWNKKSSHTIVSGRNGRTSSSTAYEMETKISYQAILYSDGERKGVIEGVVFSDKSTFRTAETPEVFKDGITKMCEDVYKQTVTFK